MDLRNTLSTAKTVGQPSTAGGSTSAGNPAKAAAHQRLLAQEQATQSTLSALGSFKAGLSDLSGAAGQLLHLDAGSTADQVQERVKGFVTAYNATVANAQRAIKANAGQDGGASQTARGLASAFGNSRTRASLASLGLQPQADGSLKLDSTALQARLKAAPMPSIVTLAQLGVSTDHTVSAALGQDAKLAHTITGQTARLAALKAQDDVLMNGGKSPTTTGTAKAQAVAQAYAAQA